VLLLLAPLPPPAPPPRRAALHAVADRGGGGSGGATAAAAASAARAAARARWPAGAHDAGQRVRHITSASLASSIERLQARWAARAIMAIAPGSRTFSLTLQQNGHLDGSKWRRDAARRRPRRRRSNAQPRPVDCPRRAPSAARRC
jgi:hypothetical protein